jgi:hypothetical protein
MSDRTQIIPPFEQILDESLRARLGFMELELIKARATIAMQAMQIRNLVEEREKAAAPSKSPAPSA